MFRRRLKKKWHFNMRAIHRTAFENEMVDPLDSLDARRENGVVKITDTGFPVRPSSKPPQRSRTIVNAFSRAPSWYRTSLGERKNGGGQTIEWWNGNAIETGGRSERKRVSERGTFRDGFSKTITSHPNSFPIFPGLVYETFIFFFQIKYDK